MRLSIVIPVFDEDDGIAFFLDSLQSMRHAGHELIVVDGGSSDATLQHAAPLADRIIRSPRGRAQQMNAGAAVASGEVILFLHATCRCASAEREERQISVLYERLQRACHERYPRR